MSVGTLTSIVNAKTGLGCTYKESDGTVIYSFYQDKLLILDLILKLLLWI